VIHVPWGGRACKGLMCGGEGMGTPQVGHLGGSGALFTITAAQGTGDREGPVAAGKVPWA
jgi:hypothetical protein